MNDTKTGEIKRYHFGTIERHSYNADGIRVAKTVSAPGAGAGSASATGATTTRYVIDGQNVLAETDESGRTLATWTHASGKWGGLLAEHRGTETRTFGFDASSNTRLLTASAGSVAATFALDAFGVAQGASGDGHSTPFLFGGEYGYWRDGEERYYVRARYYEAQRGCWDSPDPVGYQGGDWNLRRYVGNAAGVGIDPSGMLRCGEGTSAAPGWHCAYFIKAASTCDCCKGPDYSSGAPRCYGASCYWVPDCPQYKKPTAPPLCPGPLTAYRKCVKNCIDAAMDQAIPSEPGDIGVTSYQTIANYLEAGKEVAERAAAIADLAKDIGAKAANAMFFCYVGTCLTLANPSVCGKNDPNASCLNF